MEVTRLYDLIDRCRERFSHKTDTFAAKENVQWVSYSFEHFERETMAVSYGLLAMGMKGGDKIATLSNNRPEWNFLDLGMLQAGCIHVPIYPTISDTDLKYILKDAEIKLIVVSDELLWDKVSAA